jgi:putative FmdB family regulatory protein
MKKLFEFKCSSCEEVFEELTEYKKVSTCPSCGADADKIISTPRVSLEGLSGSFPGAAAAWEKKHKQQLIKETKKAQS